MGTIIGDYIGTTVRDPFPHFPTKHQTAEKTSPLDLLKPWTYDACEGAQRFRR